MRVNPSVHECLIWVGSRSVSVERWREIERSQNILSSVRTSSIDFCIRFFSWNICLIKHEVTLLIQEKKRIYMPLPLQFNSVYDEPIQFLHAKWPTPITSLSEVEFGWKLTVLLSFFSTFRWDYSHFDRISNSIFIFFKK